MKKRRNQRRNKTTGRIGEQNHPALLKAISEGLTANQLGEMFSVNPETVRKFARKRGLKIVRQDMTKENHPSWSGGHTIDRSGYILRRVEVNGPHGYLIRALRHPDPRGYAPVHRIVMHDKLGRKLKKGEVVDHIDGNVKNNDPDNLRVFSSNAEHLRATLKGKVPNWTPEGKARMTGRPPKKQPDNPPIADPSPAPTETQTKSDGHL